MVIGFYKPVSNALKAAGAIKMKEDEKLKFDKITLILLICAAFVSAVSVVVMFTVI